MKKETEKTGREITMVVVRSDHAVTEMFLAA